MTLVMWFRRDLRTEDNKALAQALASGQPILCVFHINPDQLREPAGPNQQAFFQAVQAFRRTLAEQEIDLHLLSGDLVTAFSDLADRLPDWTDVYFNYDEAGFGRGRDQRAAAFFRERGIRIHAYQDHYLHGSQEVRNQMGQPYKVFTPYFRAWQALAKEAPVFVDLALGKWQSLPTAPALVQQLDDLAAGPVFYQTGSRAAQERLASFVQTGLATYDQDRDIPSLAGTSRLSPYLRTGELSIRTVYQAVSQAPASSGRATFIKELAWREFYNMIHVAYPDQKDQAIQTAFRQLVWDNDEALFEAWKAGRTGYPIVDAAMRQLRETGWMHNRLRMIVASFLTKDLLIDWRWGERYFQEVLIDYDAASNIGGWQWAASTGTDAVPYFRIFNPVTQGKKVDPAGFFVRSFVPELGRVPDKYLHEPWKMSLDLQASSACLIGQDYPAPIVDHAQQRLRALAIYQESKEIAAELED